MSFLLVATGGFIGALTRYLVSLTWNQSSPLKPYGTWIANVSGSILLGILFVSMENGTLTESIWLIFGVGFCGAYTTFSTFGTEALSMLLAKNIKKAVIYIFSSLVLSIGSVILIFTLFK